MARILFAWELGGGGGHITQLAPIAADLIARGHAVSIVSRDARGTQNMLRGIPAEIHQAPPLLGRFDAQNFADSYAEILLRCGYDDPGLLSTMIDAWRASIGRLTPDLVIADFAPTAMLAARLLGVPVAAIGQGFSLPPRRRPLPFTRDWDEAPPGRIAALDAQATGAINAAIAGCGQRLAAVEELFDVAATFMCCFPELDHYEDREETDYFGPIYANDEGAEPDWPAGDGPRVFAYGNSGHVLFPALLAALREVGLPTLVYARGLAPAPARAAEGPRLRIAPAPFRLASVLASCDFVICQGVGTASAALVAGRPPLLMPEYLEQAMTMNRVVRQGLGVGVHSNADANTFVTALGLLRDNPGYRERAARFAARYHGFDPKLPAAAIAQACSALL